MSDSRYRVSVKALIQDEAGHILLLQTTQDGWELPGGGMDYGEEPIQALRREIQEELGVEAKSIENDPMLVLTDKTPVGKRAGQWRLWLVYRATVNSDEIVIGNEVDALDWKYLKAGDLEKSEIDPTEYKLLKELGRLGY